MNKNILSAIEFLQKDWILNSPMIEALNLNEATLLNFDEDGVAIMHKEKILMLSLTNDEALIKYADIINRGQLTLFYGCTDPDSIRRICPAVNHTAPCYQMVYTAKNPPEIKAKVDIEFRQLDESYAQFIFDNYTLKPQNVDSIRYLMRLVPFFGAFVDGKIAGFVGKHQDNSMGLLEVLPEYKRLGIGRALEAFIIGYVMKEGRVPFGHVNITNTISEQLQKSIEGVEIAKKYAVWFTIKKKCN